MAALVRAARRRRAYPLQGLHADAPYQRAWRSHRAAPSPPGSSPQGAAGPARLDARHAVGLRAAAASHLRRAAHGAAAEPDRAPCRVLCSRRERRRAQAAGVDGVCGGARRTAAPAAARVGWNVRRPASARACGARPERRRVLRLACARRAAIRVLAGVRRTSGGAHGVRTRADACMLRSGTWSC